MHLSKLISRIEPILSILAVATALLPYLTATFDKVPLRPSLDWLPPVTMVLSAIAALLGLQIRPSPRVILLPVISAIAYFALVTFYPAPLNSEAWDRVLRFLLGVTYVASFTGISLAAAAIVRELAALVTSSDALAPAVPTAKTMRILVVAANPTTTTPLDLENEIRSLEEQLRQVKYRDAISLNARLAAQPDDLVRYVREDKPNVVHFSGHGEPEGILMRAEGQSTVSVPGSALGDFFRDRAIDLVVLNSCYSRHQADPIQRAVRAVVGTTGAVDDEAARRFSVALYRGLGNGLSISEAARDARDAVKLYALPDVFHTAGDLQLRLTGESLP